jgi:hypothetical protein
MHQIAYACSSSPLLRDRCRGCNKPQALSAKLTELLLDETLSCRTVSARWRDCPISVHALAQTAAGSRSVPAKRCWLANAQSSYRYLALRKYNSGQHPNAVAPFNTMSLHELQEIKRKTELFLTSIVEVISDLERHAVPTENPSQLSVGAKRNRRTNSTTHDPEDRDKLAATLSNIITEASRLRDSLKPREGNISTPALREESASSDQQHAIQTTATALNPNTTQADSPTDDPNGGQTKLAAASLPTGPNDAHSNEQVAARAPMDERRSKLAIASELSELSSAATVEETEQTMTVKEDGTQQHQAKKAQTLRFTCEAADLGQNMTRTIAKAIKALGEERVIGHGYLLLDVESLPAVNWADLSRDATTPPKDEIVGFSYVKGTQGVAHSFCASRKLKFVFPDFSGPALCAPHVNPEQDFQDTIDHPPSGDLAYYVGVPLGALPHTDFVHPSDKLKEQDNGQLLGINTPYWYISTCRGTPANLHVEDGRTGSVNLLLAGALKDWLFVHQRSKAKFEACL